MKTIGLMGGMSWESSLEYYRIINDLIQEKLGSLHSAQCLMYSVDFNPIENWMRAGQWDLITEELLHVAQILEKGGADFILICTNTMHKLISPIQAGVSIPIYHIADATGYKIKEAGLKKIGLLGTKYTMEGDFYRKRLEQNFSLQILIPDEKERIEINRIIFEELVKGKITKISRAFYKTIIEKLHSQGAEGIILGCTEIPLLIKPEDSPIPIFDTTLIHAAYAVEKSLE